MSASRIALFSAKVAAIAGAAFIVVATPAIGATAPVAEGGGTSQTPPPTTNGNPWND